ncbi:UPF0259 membrane protein YciC [Buchnera aphidicola (Cinara piceae)]|uniref:UPF0259 membrane protein YciC n=1 Tax=Buchnera aphidicola (Cinara piceae) TaxID=1660043 RepID=A0A803FTS4_9GAMM|nr:UPF0259 membrane protein YciC [Buchnera aphidicola (Cinara piceae)]
MSNIYIIMYDTYQFFYKNIINIFVYSIISALINIFLQNIFSIKIIELSILYTSYFFKKESLFNIIYNMNINQKKVIFYIEFIKAFCSIISNFFLFISVLYLIYFISSSILKNIYYTIIKIFQSFFLCMPLLYLQFLLIGTKFNIFILPKVLLSLASFMSLIIFFIEKKNIFYSFIYSIKILLYNMYIIMPIILLNLIFRKLIFIFFKIFFMFPAYINIFLLNFFINIYFSYIIIYLFRFYIYSKVNNINN